MLVLLLLSIAYTPFHTCLEWSICTLQFVPCICSIIHFLLEKLNIIWFFEPYMTIYKIACRFFFIAECCAYRIINVNYSPSLYIFCHSIFSVKHSFILSPFENTTLNRMNATSVSSKFMSIIKEEVKLFVQMGYVSMVDIICFYFKI